MSNIWNSELKSSIRLWLCDRVCVCDTFTWKKKGKKFTNKWSIPNHTISKVIWRIQSIVSPYPTVNCMHSTAKKMIIKSWKFPNLIAIYSEESDPRSVMKWHVYYHHHFWVRTIDWCIEIYWNSHEMQTMWKEWLIHCLQYRNCIFFLFQGRRKFLCATHVRLWLKDNLFFSFSTSDFIEMKW